MAIATPMPRYHDEVWGPTNQVLGIPDENPLYPSDLDAEQTDLAYMHKLDPCRVKNLKEYIYRFAESAIPFMDPESAAYVREILERVVDHLAPKHRDGHLIPYKKRDCPGTNHDFSPDKGGSVAFEDFSGDPHRPTFISSFSVPGFLNSCHQTRKLFPGNHPELTSSYKLV